MAKNLNVMNVAIIQRVLPRYRLPVFEKIGRSYQTALTVYSGDKLGIRESVTDSQTPAFKLCSVYTAEIRILGLTFCIQPGVPWHILFGRHDALIVEASPWVLSNWLVFVIAKLKRTPIIGWGSGSGKVWNSKLQTLFSPIQKLLFKFVFDACIAYGSSSAELFNNLGHPKDKIFLAWNSIDTEETEKRISEICNDSSHVEKLKKQLGLNTYKTVLFVGQLQPPKQIPNLLKAFAIIKRNLPDCGLIIVGDGPERNYLQEVSQSLSLDDVIFLGDLRGKNLAEIFVVADVFVLPGWGGLAIQEAVSYGLPVVTTRGDGTAVDLVQNEINGFILSEGKPEYIAEKIRTILTDDTLCKNMGKQSRQIALHKINIDTMVEGFLNAIRSVNSRPNI